MSRPALHSRGNPWRAGVDCPVPRGAGQGRGRARDRRRNVRPGLLSSESVGTGLGEWLVPVAAGAVVASRSAGTGVLPVFVWRIRQRGQRPSGAFACCSAPQLGQRFECAAMGKLRRARRHPSAIGRSAEARAQSSVSSGVLSHKRAGRGYQPVPPSSLAECGQ
jgi:hypothetical protein